MNPRATPVAIPPDSEIHRQLPGAYFSDAYELPMDAMQDSALALYLRVVSGTPAWVEGLLWTRNRIVGLFGLKNVGAMGAIDEARPAATYRVGDRVGIFTIRALSEREVILGDDDKHLTARLSVCKSAAGAAPGVTVSTVVHVRNTLGRLYLLFVVPVHRRLVPTMMRRLAPDA